MSDRPDQPADATGDHRTGVAAGIAAYSLWGSFPLVFHQLRSVGAAEVLLHRIVWSFVVVMALLLVRRDARWWRTTAAAPGSLPRLAAAGVLIAVNWVVYIWAVAHDHVVEAALGYYVNPLLTVALGVVVLGERLGRLQRGALGFGAAAVVVLTVAYGRVPWIALVLACSFAGYGFLKKAVTVDAVTSLAVETTVLLPVAVIGFIVLAARHDVAFTNGSTGRDALLVALGVVTAGPLLLFGVAATRVPLSLLGLLQYLTPTLQLLCGVAVLGEPMPPERLVGFALVWVALVMLGVDAVRSARQRSAQAALASLAATPTAV